MISLKKRLAVFAHICRRNPTHKLCAERVTEAMEDIDKLETIIQEMVSVGSSHEVYCPFTDEVDLSEVVSFPERLREALR